MDFNTFHNALEDSYQVDETPNLTEMNLLLYLEVPENLLKSSKAPIISHEQ